MDQKRRPGLTEALIAWALCAAVAVAAFATYSRLPPEDLYHTSGTGIEAGASRVLVFLGYPFSIVAIALAAIAAARVARAPRLLPRRLRRASARRSVFPG
jgi:hypothetical protein